MKLRELADRDSRFKGLINQLQRLLIKAKSVQIIIEPIELEPSQKRGFG